MSIIYSYPTIQPTVDDLLIGTDTSDDNATKSFTVQSLVSLINAAAGSGTVTSVQIATDSFLSATGGPITDAGTITIGLTATGTPDATTFLRGDNQWVTPTVSAGINVLNSNVVLTNDIQSLNFTGAGVTASLTSTGAVTVTVDGATQGVTSVQTGLGISTNTTTGDITLTNTGVTSLTAGGGISLDTTTGAVTISTINQPQGTVTSVTVGEGLVLSSGDITENPEIALDYDGSDTYITNPSTGNPQATDNFAFQKGASGVRQGTFDTLPVASLTAVKSYIDNEDTKAVKHDTDTFTSVGDVYNVISLTATEYTNLATKDGNTLYLTTTSAPTTYTKTLAITDTITGGTLGTDYEYAGDVAGSALSGASGSNFAFNTTINVLNSSKEFAGAGNPSITNASGTFDQTNSVTTSISGTMTAVTVPPGSTTLSTSWNIGPSYSSAVLGTDYSVTYTAPATRSGTAGASFDPATLWNVTITNLIPAKWSLVSPQVTYSGTATYSGSTITANILGAMSLRQYFLGYSITDGITGGTLGTDYEIIVTGSLGTISNTLSSAQQKYYNTSASAYSITVAVNALAGNTITGLSGTGTTNTALTANTTIPFTLSGAVQSNQSSITLNPTGSFTPSAAYPSPGVWGYSINGGARINGTSAVGTVGQSVTFSFLPNPPSIASGYTQVSQTITTATGTFTSSNQTLTAEASAAAIVTRVTSSYNSTSHVSSTEACQEASTSDALYLEKGSGSSSYVQTGDTCYTTATGAGVVAAGYYKAFVSGGAGWMRITGSAGVVQSVGNC